jgi:hypothetical protein
LRIQCNVSKVLNCRLLRRYLPAIAAREAGGNAMPFFCATGTEPQKAAISQL